MSNFKKYGSKKVLTNKPLLKGEDLELHIDEENINSEIMDQPLRYKKWAKLKAEVSKKAKIIKGEFERMKASKRLEFAKTGARVKELDSMVAVDEEVKELQLQLFDAEEMLDQYDGILRAFYQRHEMLKDLCANLRKQLLD
jgi:hypothetical protein